MHESTTPSTADRLAQLEATVEQLVARLDAMSDEVRTRRVVVESSDGTERIRLHTTATASTVEVLPIEDGSRVSASMVVAAETLHRDTGADASFAYIGVQGENQTEAAMQASDDGLAPFVRLESVDHESVDHETDAVLRASTAAIKKVLRPGAPDPEGIDEADDSRLALKMVHRLAELALAGPTTDSVR